MNPRKLVIAAVALVAMVTVAKYTRGMGMSMQELYKTPQGQQMYNKSWEGSGLNYIELKPIEILNQMSAEQKTSFDNWLRQEGLKPETMTPQQKAAYVKSFQDEQMQKHWQDVVNSLK